MTTLFDLPPPIINYQGEEVAPVEILLCHRCYSKRLYKPVNTPEEDRDYTGAGIFMLYCWDCRTFQNHEGKEASYKAITEMRNGSEIHVNRNHL